jgi:hypothetical protein
MALPGLVAARNLADVTDRERAWDNIGANIQTDVPFNNLYDYIGFPMAGGYFAGYISHTANGAPTHALIVAPRATGATGGGYDLTTFLQHKTTNTITANTTSLFDGAANTAAMVAAGIANHPAAGFCKNLSIGGFTDWYFPALFELNIAYFHLKPTATLNNPAGQGINPYSVPRRDSANTATFPGQTTVVAFNTNTEAFIAGEHISSTQTNNIDCLTLSFSTGSSPRRIKTGLSFVRAFRRIEL